MTNLKIHHQTNYNVNAFKNYTLKPCLTGLFLTKYLNAIHSSNLDFKIKYYKITNNRVTFIETPFYSQ